MANFLTREPLSRRALLKGAGVALALPWLEAMLPRAAYARGLFRSAAPLRLAFLFAPNGKFMRDWTPAETGTDYALPPTLAPLAELRSTFTVFSGLTHDNANAKADGPGDHARSAACFLTGAHPRKTEGADIRNGVSIDQALAERIGGATRLRSLELGTEPALTSGNCDSGYSCAYSSNVSWRTATTPLLKETDPRLAFERLFGDPDADADPELAARRRARRQSLLDGARDSAARLELQLGATDRRKLDEYLTAVRELELRIARAGDPDEQARRAATAATRTTMMAAGIPSDFGEHVRLMNDLLVLAFATDTTRVATFMHANDGSNRSYPQVGVPEGHHEMSHHGNDPAKQAKVQKIERFHVEQLAHLLAKLQATPDGDGSLLDHSLILYGSGISDGNAHNHDNLPILLAGRGNGTANPGRHVRVASLTPLCNLFLALLERANVRLAAFGDSTGHLIGV